MCCACRDISSWASHELYHDLLLPHDSNANHRLSDLVREQYGSPAPTDNAAQEEDLSAEELTELADTVLMLLDTSAEGMEEDTCRGGSYRNSAEAEVVVSHVYHLYELGLTPEQV